MHTLYTIGYTGRTPEDLAAIVQAHNAMLIDTRFAPRSRVAHWEGGALQRRFGGRYFFMGYALGNRNYNNDGEMQLADPGRAIEPVRSILERQPAILLCACVEAPECHRWLAAEYLEDQLGCEVEHIPPPSKRKKVDSLPAGIVQSDDLLSQIPEPKSTIYVDQLVAYPQKATSGGRYFGSGKESCHLATDGNLEELHRFAQRIGLKREWFQPHRSVPHYDLTPSRRAAAVRAGAVEVSSQELVRLCRRVDTEPVTCWQPTTVEDYELCRRRVLNWTVDGKRLAGYPWDKDPRETMHPTEAQRAHGLRKGGWE